jgi:RIO kinase 1
MNTTMRYPIDFDDFDELEGFDTHKPKKKKTNRNAPRLVSRWNPNYQPKRKVGAVVCDLSDDEYAEATGFIKTFVPSRHERVWIEEAIGPFYNQRWISDILRKVKGGKEANVYLCAGDASAPMPLLAAKVYRPRNFRNLRKDHIYREGRANLDEAGNEITNAGMQHAMQKKSAYGQDLLHSSWMAYELAAMEKLHAAGADVPAPFARSSNAILMGYIGDRDFPAPILQSIRLEVAEARRLFDRVVENIRVMLAHDLIHGDLSAYNILYWQGEITLIDFPQVVAPGQNRNAFRIFERDVLRVCEYFQRQGVPCQPDALAHDLWKSRGLRTLPEIDPGLLDGESDEDKAFWQHLHED